MLRLRVRVRAKPANRPSPVQAARMRLVVTHRPLRVLDFDVEARPLHWISGDYVSKEITAIAWAWTDAPDQVTCYLLGKDTQKRMLTRFVRVYNQADLVTGHFIRGYDLPMINGALTELGLPSLTKKLTQDTKLDLVKRQGISVSQENLGAMLGLHHPKVKMNQATWRSANRLTPKGIRHTKERVVGDVQQHIELRARLIELGYLGPTVPWVPGVAAPEVYVP